MIPMLRVLASAVSGATWVVTVLLSASSMSRRDLPAVVGEGLVGFGHLVCVLAALHTRAEAVARVQQLVHQSLGHRLLAALPRVTDQPAQRERRTPPRTNLDRHLVGRATDTTALDLDRGLDVVERALECHDRVGAGLGAAAFERFVDDPLRER